jgi:hypothetical protein
MRYQKESFGWGEREDTRGVVLTGERERERERGRVATAAMYHMAVDGGWRMENGREMGDKSSCTVQYCNIILDRITKKWRLIDLLPSSPCRAAQRHPTHPQTTLLPDTQRDQSVSRH